MGTQISTSVTIISSLLGFQAISLTDSEIGNEALPTIVAGSKVEIAGAFFNFATADTPQASTWTAISTISTAYITLTPSGSAGSQILTSKWAADAPVWSEAKQGYYASDASTIRYIGAVYKGGAVSATAKEVFPVRQEQPGTFTMELGEWDMETDISVSIPGFFERANGTVVSIIGVDVVIYGDNGSIWPFSHGGTRWNEYLVPPYEGQKGLTIYRTMGGSFDHSSFNGTASTVANRGYATATYKIT